MFLPVRYKKTLRSKIVDIIKERSEEGDDSEIVQ
jgi:hypothetical protein